MQVADAVRMVRIPSGVSAEEVEVVDTARELAGSVLARNAARYDEAASFPADNFRALRESGLLKVCIPKSHGGHGMSTLGYVTALKQLAKGCGSTAVSFHMHNAVMRLIALVGSQEQKDFYYGKVIDEGILIGSWGTEPVTSWASSSVSVTTTYKPVAGGFEISGAKHFCSLSDGCTYGQVYAVAEDKVGRSNLKHVQVFFVKVGQPGLVIRDEWNPLGMRATVSKPVILTNHFVPPMCRLGEEGDLIRHAPSFFSFFPLGHAVAYQGISEAAFDWAVQYATTRVLKPFNHPISHFDRVQRKVSEMSIAIMTGALAIEHAARVLDDPNAEPGDLLLASNQAKPMAARASLDVTGWAIDVGGGPSITHGNPPERYHRDARTGVLMVPAIDQCLENVARHELHLQVPAVSG